MHLFPIYADIECLIIKISGIKNNPKKLSATKLSEHIPCGNSMSIICEFHDIKNKHDVYRGQDCMKKFCETLKEHVVEIINFKKRQWYH